MAAVQIALAAKKSISSASTTSPRDRPIKRPAVRSKKHFTVILELL
jgi:hypothetical protein